MEISKILRLCDFRKFSYSKTPNVALTEIQEQTGGYKIVWGPAWYMLASLVYVIETPLGMTVVIRGTHTRSITNIVFDDMRLALVKMEGVDGRICKGLRRAVHRTLSLRPRKGFPSQDQSLADFIKL